MEKEGMITKKATWMGKEFTITSLKIFDVENENVIENVFDNIESLGLILPSGEVIIEEYGKRN